MLKQQFAKFNQLMQGIEKIYEEYAKSVGLSYMSLTVLQIIYYSQTPCTQKEICAQCHYNKQIVNSIVKGFTCKGYLCFVEAPNDRRNKFVVLTDAGREYAHTVLQPLWEMEQKALSVLKEDEWNEGLRILERCYNGFLNCCE